MKTFSSWGRYPKAKHLREVLIDWRCDAQIPEEEKSVLAVGLGRSYGDSCLNNDGILLLCKHLNRLISFDKESGILHAEAGASLAQIIDFALPHGFFLPVTPGTKFVTLAGAIANDVHGKNHHRAGTFGNHVEELELLRSNGERLICSSKNNKELFAATIAGLGLTGLILSAKIRLKPVKNAFIEAEYIQFEGLEEFFELSKSSDETYEYSVSWLDSLSEKTRGIFIRGNHAEVDQTQTKLTLKLPLSVPFNFPDFALNRYSVSAFNWLYFNKQFEKEKKLVQHYHPFFYPLDSIDGWNKIYGKRGFMQFQCVLPESKKDVLIGILKKVSSCGDASFLSVLKNFGASHSPGMLSFPRKGITLCLDFANRGEKTLQFLKELDRDVFDAGGAIYPAKDSFMASASFLKYYPRVAEFKEFIDPKFSSSFWQRVNSSDA